MPKLGGIVHVRLESSEFSCEGLQIARLEGHEALGELFCFDLDLSQVGTGLLSMVDLAATSAAMLGSTASIVFERHGETVRSIHGLITEVDEAIDPREDKAAEAGALRVRLMPRAFRLGLVELHEVFLNKSIPDIIKEKLERIDLVGDDLEFRLGGNYPVREFVVQYKETDLAFITRLCERYGITYRFEHEDKVDKIVFMDLQSSFEPIAAHALVSGEGDEIIKDLRSNSRLVPAVRAVSDFNPILPQLNLQEHVDVPGGDFGGVIDLVTNYKTTEQGTQLAGIRAEQTECHRVLLRGQSGAPLFSAGAIVPLSDAPTLEDPTMLLTRVSHRIKQQAGLLGGESALPYENTFEAVRGAVQYRPLHKTPIPRVYGVITGFIEEYLANGQYAVLDERGRYWVRFEYDATPHPDKHSLPIRMMQPHAGPSYGMHLPLKRGTEVMVSFLDGDVDRPVIVGSVPNELTQSPVNRSNYQINKLLKTETGIVIEARDVWEPEAPYHQQKPGS